MFPSIITLKSVNDFLLNSNISAIYLNIDYLVGDAVFFDTSIPSTCDANPSQNFRQNLPWLVLGLYTMR